MAVAAYAAVVSLKHVLDQIQHPARYRLHLDRKQIEALQEKVSFLQDFLEVYFQIKSRELEGLARQISDVANEAEDIIDSHVVDQIREGFPDHSTSLTSFCINIERVMEKIDFIKQKLMMVKEETVIVQEQQPPGNSSAPPSSGKNTMVGFDEHLVRVMDELTGYKSDLQIIALIGMGGIGKTTLARNIFEHPYIVHHFHIQRWCTISQEYSMREILLSLLNLEKKDENGEDLAELGEQLYKNLSGRRYLIVMDDVWNTKVWNGLRLFFPDNMNGSRVILTSRLSNVAVSLSSHNPYLIDFLDEDKSWDLFCKKAFRQEGCPLELVEIGKNIVKSCKGLPLAIVVIGGLLSKSNMTREHWEFVAENVGSFTNSANDDYCLKILSLSYNHLPLYLKPCFLYMKGFPEDNEIKVSKLIKLWVAEGFLKPIKGKTLEEVAEEYLMDLIDRNLILIHKRKHSGKIKTCIIHDLLRDLCIGESQKEHFYCAAKVQQTYYSTDLSKTCFLCNSDQNTSTRIYLPRVRGASQATTLGCCLVCDICRIMHPQLNRLRLVRVAKFHELMIEPLSPEFLQPTKLRYLDLWNSLEFKFKFVYSSIPLLWNLQTLLVDDPFRDLAILPSQVWELPQLRHLVTDEVVLPDHLFDQTDRKDSIVLENLQTLSGIINFRCSEEFVERVPNLKKLKIKYYRNSRAGMKQSYYSLHNLACLLKLESLVIYGELFILKMAFPHSLKNLGLHGCRIPWKEMTIIGSLPNLEVLKLYYNACEGPEWNPLEGEFLRLKLLLIDFCGLVCWRAEEVHFPTLESLVLRSIEYLEKIPPGIGEIETLRSIHLYRCTESVVNSAKEILEEQQSLGNEDLQLHID